MSPLLFVDENGRWCDKRTERTTDVMLTQKYGTFPPGTDTQRHPTRCSQAHLARQWWAQDMRGEWGRDPYSRDSLLLRERGYELWAKEERRKSPGVEYEG